MDVKDCFLEVQNVSDASYWRFTDIEVHILAYCFIGINKVLFYI